MNVKRLARSLAHGRLLNKWQPLALIALPSGCHSTLPGPLLEGLFNWPEEERHRILRMLGQDLRAITQIVEEKELRSRRISCIAVCVSSAYEEGTFLGCIGETGD